MKRLLYTTIIIGLAVASCQKGTPLESDANSSIDGRAQTEEPADSTTCTGGFQTEDWAGTDSITFDF